MAAAGSRSGASRVRLHLVANAHIDPVWLWEWEEGVAAALSTFRSAAELAERFGTFVFNHNEALLYQWVEEHEPELFRRIQRLVRAGRWHIMGGWFLQPDCNMPNGESFVRQITSGRRYFTERFGARPTTAINFDPFGHTRGLVQILKKSGFDSYLFCRPGPNDKAFDLAADNFVWVGFDGSEILARRDPMAYHSPLGKAVGKIERYLGKYADRDPGMLLWGVGDHGGGPSREDLAAIEKFRAAHPEIDLVHSTPEAFFADLDRSRKRLPRRAKDLNPWAVGCYTSQTRIKQAHRRLENELFLVEKMTSTAALAKCMPYPRDELAAAERDLLIAQFHDILPGSSIQAVEDTSLRLMSHALERLSRLKARAFFKLAVGQKAATGDRIPILAYNPHPFSVRMIIECELQLADQNWSGTFVNLTVQKNGRSLPTQIEKEASNLALDWRKRVVFEATLASSTVSRFDCVLTELPAKPPMQMRRTSGNYEFRTRRLTIRINGRTGLLDRYVVDGRDFVRPGACRAEVFHDNADPWAMKVSRFSERIGSFTPMSGSRSAQFSGVAATRLPAVRVVEDGAVRTVIEATSEYGDSQLLIQYQLPKAGTAIGVLVRVHWSEKDRMLKLAVPLAFGSGRFLGQVAYGVQELPMTGDEAVAQKWIAAVGRRPSTALTVINAGTYGCSFDRETIFLSLLRSPAYSGHPIPRSRDAKEFAAAPSDKRFWPIVPQDRYSPRIDQGERTFQFWIDGGASASRLAAIDREALVRNEAPMVLSFFPSGAGRLPTPGLKLSDTVVQMTACRINDDGSALVVRLYEPTGRARKTTLRIPALRVRRRIRMRAFEIKTLCIGLRSRRMTETNLLEETSAQAAQIFK